jgi:glycosyltransferase involved in cell wall biosynthesis
VKVRSSQRRVAVVTNIVAPYRSPVFRELARQVELRVFFSAETEPNRRWSVQRELDFSHEIIAGPSVVVRGRVIYITPRLVSRLFAFRPSLVVAGGFSLPTIYAFLFCIATGARLIIMNEGTRQTEARLGPVSRFLRWALVRAANAYVAVGSMSAERLHDLGAHSTRCVVAPYSLDVADRPTRDYSSAGNVARILYVGQFITRKGVLQLLDAVANLRDRDAITLTVVGHGPLEGEVRSVITARSLESCVTLRGFVDQPELPSVYAEHDLLVFPSLEEVFGLVLLEAMAAGLPVIASCFAGATRDLVDDGSTGWIMDPSAADGIVSALEEALASRRLWPDLGARARQRAQECSPQLAAERIVHALTIAELPRRARQMQETVG